MKSILKLILVMTTASALSAVAQMSQPDRPSTKKDHMSGKAMSMTGCVSEKDGKYMMSNKEHTDGVLLMSSKDLKPHVGHKVKVTGMMQKMAGDSTKSEDKMASGESMKHDDMSMMTMNVSEMKMVSEKCEMPKM